MHRALCSLAALLVITAIGSLFGSSANAGYNPDDYADFLSANANIGSGALALRHAPSPEYHLTAGDDFNIEQYAWLDSVIMKFELTPDEIGLLAEHGFMVTERVRESPASFLLYNVWGHDLPVFISTDAVMAGLEWSFEQTWKEMEARVMAPNLREFLAAAYNAVPLLIERYGDSPALADALADADLYVTVARALAEGVDYPLHTGVQDVYDAVMAAIEAETMLNFPLFSDRARPIDFSQFVPRGRYTDYVYVDGVKVTLAEYFKAMMWLGRMEFYLTPPPENPWETAWTPEQIRRMCMGAMMVNELIDLSGERRLLEANERITDYMVGESDNCTPAEYDAILAGLDIEGPAALLDTDTYDALQAALLAAPEASQQILGNILMVDPFSSEPSALPASYRLMGQRFIVDSCIFSNVVYDRIVHNGEKIWRPLPDPLDAMFALGNDDAIHLLRDELDEYRYAPQLASLRYLVDAYDPAFWESSIYNRWLSALRALNPSSSPDRLPAFATTAAWRQEKLTTQLSSWTHLRHATILYAKQSYTGGSKCSFPHSYVEPYPAFFRELQALGESAAAFFGEYPDTEPVVAYYARFAEITGRLADLAEKELAAEPFSMDDEEFCRQMLFEQSGSGLPPFTGWFTDLFYQGKADTRSMVIADVHTQPTDRFGNPVGNVLHVATGMFDLAVVLAPSPSADFAPMAFAGPVLSYYELVTTDFDRMDDSRWSRLVWEKDLPPRPDWVNVYLADTNGARYAPGRVLPTVEHPVGLEDSPALPSMLRVLPNAPNPFNPSTSIRFLLPENGRARVAVYDILGRRVALLADQPMIAGEHAIMWDASGFASGVYFCRVEAGGTVATGKMLLMK